MLQVLTVNLGAAARPRAEALLQWLAGRPEEVFVLTETSAGPGTTYLLDQFRAAGYAVVKSPDERDRGAAVVSRVKIAENGTPRVPGISIPGRVAVCLLDTDPPVFVVAVYVPSRDRTENRTARKQQFITSFLATLGALPAEVAAHTLVGGDYNVIGRDHQPRHRGFLQFEYNLLETLEAAGYTDTHTHLHPGAQPHSWIGRTGDGYRYDYLHAGAALAERIRGCEYLHQIRLDQLTDHAALTLSLDVTPTLLSTSDPATSGALF
ncbi:endonuclease/exonuclease/phosphatase family protein [Actinomadura rupiterrae]|uniref:endonuclease/exonuclease/phosphatase family protein n=1 Tax=Actinomadura rupiterrae TaxID=559627 RepID=UPI0020A30228|nr:endonuclease/exonuclease/phosphatase family protein [Actinomadura rupiterrae]MCP2343556.1 exodeoxyribonuclease-3 [Actinomadura rupiterrae]